MLLVAGEVASTIVIVAMAEPRGDQTPAARTKEEVLCQEMTVLETSPSRTLPQCLSGALPINERSFYLTWPEQSF